MSLDDTIRARRSIRGLEGPPLPPEEVEALVALALTAPAPHHTQPWRFAEVGHPRREALASAMGAAWRADLEQDGVAAARIERALERSRGRSGICSTVHSAPAASAAAPSARATPMSLAGSQTMASCSAGFTPSSFPTIRAALSDRLRLIAATS